MGGAARTAEGGGRPLARARRSIYSLAFRSAAVMRIPVEQVQSAPTVLTYSEEVGELNQRLAAGPHDVQLEADLVVDLTYYRAEGDVVVEGALAAPVQATCARCAEPFGLPFRTRFRVISSPRAAMDRESRELSCDDLGLAFYEGDEIDVTAFVHEYVLLAMPTRPLCDEACRGLCVRCGTNLNLTTCDCPGVAERPRFAVLHDLVQARRGQN